MNLKTFTNIFPPLLLCSILYILTVLFGFIIFGGLIHNDVLANFDIDPDIPYRNLLYIVVSAKSSSKFDFLSFWRIKRNRESTYAFHVVIDNINLGAMQVMIKLKDYNGEQCVLHTIEVNGAHIVRHCNPST
nr:hypothetical protein MtrDRAFT_AC147482g41v2 [Medicago truncatula]